MSNIFEKALDSIISHGESKEIKDMRERAKERDENEPVKKTDHELQTEKNISDSMKINNEESLI